MSFETGRGHERTRSTRGFVVEDDAPTQKPPRKIWILTKTTGQEHLNSGSGPNDVSVCGLETIGGETKLNLLRGSRAFSARGHGQNTAPAPSINTLNAALKNILVVLIVPSRYRG